MPWSELQIASAVAKRERISRHEHYAVFSKSFPDSDLQFATAAATPLP
jgi:hypothetical protein